MKPFAPRRRPRESRSCSHIFGLFLLRRPPRVHAQLKLAHHYAAQTTPYPQAIRT